jgi:hypothetical protein
MTTEEFLAIEKRYEERARTNNAQQVEPDQDARDIRDLIAEVQRLYAALLSISEFSDEPEARMAARALGQES